MNNIKQAKITAFGNLRLTSLNIHTIRFPLYRKFYREIILARHIVKSKIRYSRSFTVEPRTLLDAKYNNDTFFVSLYGCEKRFKGLPHWWQVYRWIRGSRELLFLPNHYAGGWECGGIYYLDVTIAVVGKSQALDVAKKNNQQAIYHPFSGKSLFVEKELPIAI